MITATFITFTENGSSSRVMRFTGAFTRSLRRFEVGKSFWLILKFLGKLKKEYKARISGAVADFRF